jgi:hypothetical protein
VIADKVVIGVVAELCVHNGLFEEGNDIPMVMPPMSWERAVTGSIPDATAVVEAGALAHLCSERYLRRPPHGAILDELVRAGA